MYTHSVLLSVWHTCGFRTTVRLVREYLWCVLELLHVRSCKQVWKKLVFLTVGTDQFWGQIYFMSQMSFGSISVIIYAFIPYIFRAKMSGRIKAVVSSEIIIISTATFKFVNRISQRRGNAWPSSVILWSLLDCLRWRRLSHILWTMLRVFLLYLILNRVCSILYKQYINKYLQYITIVINVWHTTYYRRTYIIRSIVNIANGWNRFTIRQSSNKLVLLHNKTWRHLCGYFCSYYLQTVNLE